MTVIAGLATNIGEPAVVIGADRGYIISTEEECIGELLNSLEERPIRVPFSFTMDFLRKRGVDTIEFGMNRKIYISKNGMSTLAHTGINNPTNKNAKKIILEPEEFLQDDELIKKILRPILVSIDNSEELLRAYKQEFSLRERIHQTYIPEIRRLFEIDRVKSTSMEPLSKLVLYEKEFHKVESEYIYATIIELNNESVPMLFDVSPTGAIFRSIYTTNGSGGIDALKCMRKSLGTGPGICGGESKIEIEVDTSRAVEIVTNAIKYSNARHSECKGLEYVILTKNGLETHFSDEQKSFTVYIEKIIKERIKRLNREIKSLNRIQGLYDKHKN